MNIKQKINQHSSQVQTESSLERSPKTCSTSPEPEFFRTATVTNCTNYLFSILICG